MPNSYTRDPIAAERPLPVTLASTVEPVAPGFVRHAWTGTNMEDARAHLEEALDGRQFRAQRGRETFSFRFATAGDARASLQTGSFTGHLRGVIPWSRDYVVSWFPVGSVTINYPQGQLTSIPGMPFLTPTETSYSFSMTPHRHSIVHFDASFFEDVAATRHGRTAQRIVFDYAATPTPQALAAWKHALGEATPLITHPGTPAAERLLAQTTLAHALLDLFPWQALNIPAKIRTERTQRLRLAAEYVHAYVDQAITSHDVATAADMHPRTLQQQMSTHLGASPTSFIRDVRLDRVRLDLLAADPATARVAEIAKRWGFGNLGRFSAAYFTRFAEYPRNTLAQGESA